jgi:MoaA/NifB/PqqE/SkfB family radical SAM enzyme
MPFCFAPWSNVDISPQGQISPCCKFQTGPGDQQFDVKQTSLEQYASSQFLGEIKQQFLEGQWPKGCERCKIEEANQIKSKRQLDQERWASQYDTYDLHRGGFITASIAFGNTCNLTCITCGPWASSKWHKEYLALFGKDIRPNHFYKQDFVQDFFQSVPNLVHLDIPGGEPFVSGVSQQIQLLDLYTHKQDQISLHYTTNATIWPDNTWWHRWEHFKEIDLQISLDAVGPRFEYIRYPAKWHEVEHNIDLYLKKQNSMPNLRLSVSVTVSALNIAYLDELITWCSNKGLPEPWLGRVHYPAHLRPTVWTQKAREHVTDLLRSSSHSALHYWAGMLQSHDDSEHFDQFRHMMTKHDQYRDTCFASTFPEMSVFI